MYMVYTVVPVYRFLFRMGLASALQRSDCSLQGPLYMYPRSSRCRTNGIQGVNFWSVSDVISLGVAGGPEVHRCCIRCILLLCGWTKNQ